MPLTGFVGEDTAWGRKEDFKRNLSHFLQTNSLAVGAQYLCQSLFHIITCHVIP